MSGSMGGRGGSPKTTVAVREAPISELVDSDMRDFGAYSALSRHVPHVIDGLKPVQRRTVWMCSRGEARERLVKVSAISGLVGTIHPHGSAALSISCMVQGFPFANNYPLLSGKGTFGTEVMPGAIASERYVEARLNEFCREVLVENLAISPKVLTFDARDEEPVYIESRLPLVLLNPSQSISVGFSVSIPGHSLAEVVACLVAEAEGRKWDVPEPYFRGWKGRHLWITEPGEDGLPRRRLHTTWGLERVDELSWRIVAAPHDKTIDKVKEILSKIEEAPDSPLVKFQDLSKKTFDLRLTFRRGRAPKSSEELEDLLGRPVPYRVAYTVLWTDGTIRETSFKEIVQEFVRHRRAVKRREVEARIATKRAEHTRLSELVRFIEEGWPGKASQRRSRQSLIEDLTRADFQTAEWLSGLEIYRTTKEEVERLNAKMREVEAQIRLFERQIATTRATDFALIEEWQTLASSYEPKEEVQRAKGAGEVLSKEELLDRRSRRAQAKPDDAHPPQEDQPAFKFAIKGGGGKEGRPRKGEAPSKVAPNRSDADKGPKKPEEGAFVFRKA